MSQIKNIKGEITKLITRAEYLKRNNDPSSVEVYLKAARLELELAELYGRQNNKLEIRRLISAASCFAEAGEVKTAEVILEKVRCSGVVNDDYISPVYDLISSQKNSSPWEVES